MKRSKSLKIAMMGVGVLALTACEEPQDAAVWENVTQCINNEDFTPEACESEFKKAETEHVRTAPKYVQVSDCEADFGEGNCETAPQQTTSGGSIFMPMMMGYMMGSMLGGGRSGVASQPLYRSKDDPKNFRTGDNQKVSGKTGPTKVGSQVAKAPSTKTRTTQRGGFGAGAARMSSGKFRSFGG